MTTAPATPGITITAADVLAALRADRDRLAVEHAAQYRAVRAEMWESDTLADMERLWDVYRLNTLELEAVNRTIRRWEALAAAEAEAQEEV